MHVGLDLGRSSMSVAVVGVDGELVDEFGVRPDGPGLGRLVERVCGEGPVRAVIESMNGARFVHDFLTDAGWEVAIADALRVKGIAPLAAKTDRIDARVLAELSRLDLVPRIWVPSMGVRQERERARFRIGLVHHRTGVKNRIHAVLIAHGRPCPVSDLFGRKGRQVLAELDFGDPWDRHVAASLELIDHLNRQIRACETELRRLAAAHPYVPLLATIPGIGDILGYTIAAEIGDIGRFPTPKHLVGYTGLVPRVRQSGQRDTRGPLTRRGPRHLRWALVEAAVHAANHPTFAPRYQRTKARLGPQRGVKVARVELARRLATSIWHMLTKQQPFNPGGPREPLVA